MEYVVIMAGGAGTRLWPLSRKGMPKQLLTILDGQSLLQAAFDRAVRVVDPSRVLICAGRSHRSIIAEQLPDVPPENILGEPQGRDSLAAAAWSTAEVYHRDADGVVAVLSADHVIAPVEVFADSLRGAFAAARASQALVTFGVVPTSPHTGYGYLHIGTPVAGLDGVYNVIQFAEKPQLDVAERYVAEGDWLWNSGMFCWKASTFLRQVQTLQADLYDKVSRLVEQPELLDEIYPTLTKTSVDYAIMEPVSLGAGSALVEAVSLSASWADIGSFPALADHMASAQGNVTDGRAIVLNGHDNLVINKADGDHLIALAGLSNIVVVESGNVTLVCAKSHAEDIKQLVALATSQGEQYA